MRRIDRFEFQFDVPERLAINNFASDAPAGSYGFRLTPRSSGSFMDISWDPEAGMKSMRPAVDPKLIFSGPVEHREIVNDQGSSVGEDSWGYWDERKFWRLVRLRGSIVARYGSINQADVARYGSVNQEDSKLFDQVINSVCLAPSPVDASSYLGTRRVRVEEKVD